MVVIALELLHLAYELDAFGQNTLDSLDDTLQVLRDSTERTFPRTHYREFLIQFQTSP